jgi:hypothetical protein
MNIKDLFHLSYPLFRIRLDNEKEESISENKNNVMTGLGEESKEDTKNEWHQEYEMIYLSYLLER